MLDNVPWEGIHALPMRIGIDARLLGYRRAGIGKYTRRLIEHLAELDQQDKFIILHSRKDPDTLVEQPNFHRRTLITPSHHRLEQWLLPLETAFLGLDLLHSPDFIPPFRRNYKSVITVHDLAFLRFPHFVTAESAHHYGLIDQAVRRTDHIIAVSESTRADLVNMLGADERKVTVIHEAADPMFRPIEDEAKIRAVREKYSLADRPYIFFLSTIEPRKNLATLLRAFRILLDEYPNVNGVKLAIAGEEGWLFHEVYSLYHELHLEPHASFLGRVPQTDLPALFNGATMHVHPSFYEGFGLTPLEAMACGTPTVVSNVSSLPEVVGDAGLLVPPDEVEEWTAAMYRLLNESELRRVLSEKGLRRAAKFSWEEAARQHLEVYHRFRNH
ncbi:MAG: glycosyltransferase family 4 protein [Chloroflexota bacterium]|nr:glycosyltransferase family 4 protein [Chloroflexota bacterium]